LAIANLAYLFLQETGKNKKAKLQRSKGNGVAQSATCLRISLRSNKSAGLRQQCISLLQTNHFVFVCRISAKSCRISDTFCLKPAT
jgi:hypothetical protein